MSRASSGTGKWHTGAHIRAVIQSLDPIEDDHTIVHLTDEVLTPPLIAHIGYSSAAVKQVAVPRVAERIADGGHGWQLREPWARDSATLRHFSSLIRLGHRSAAGRDACAGLGALHRSIPGIREIDMRYTMGTLIRYPDHLANSMGRAFTGEREALARQSFWTGVCIAMGIADLPTTLDEWDALMAAYEQANCAPSHAAHLVAEAHVRAIGRWLPRRFEHLARRVLVLTLDDQTRQCSGYDEPAAIVRVAGRAAWRTMAGTTALRPMRTSATWATAFAAPGPRRLALVG